jgi:hypothetical protein
MQLRASAPLCASAALLLFAAAAMAEPRQCLGYGSAQRVVDNNLVGVVNPDGFEDQLKADRCWPLDLGPGLLFDFAQFETGVFTYVSPIYANLGAYAALAPLSFLELRAEVAGVMYWPLPLDGAGYFGRDTWTRFVPDTEMPARDGRAAAGLNVTLAVNLQAQIPLAGPVQLVVTNSTAFDYWNLGPRAFYLNARRDFVMARSDYLWKNTAFLMLEIAAAPGIGVRLGATDDLCFQPRYSVLSNIVSGWASVPMRRDGGELRDIEPYVRAGAYTSHGWRHGFQLMFGVSLAWAWPG